MKTEDIKNLAAAYQEIVAEAKKKLDAVGQADADIDNDGDVDSSDEYLHNRRKAVKKAMKDDEVEEAKRKGAPKMTGDSVAMQRAKDAALNKALGRTRTGRKKPERTMTSTQRSLASLRKEDTDLDENKHLATAGTKETIMHPKTKVAKKVDKSEVRKYVQQGWMHMGPKKNRITKEEVELDENMSLIGKELEAYARKDGGIDKMDFMKAAMMMKKGQKKELMKFVDELDTEPREKILSMMDKDADRRKEYKAYQKSKRNESVELDENKNLIKDYQDMKKDTGKKDHAILDSLMSMSKYKRLSKDQMIKIIGDAKRKGIFKEEVELDEAYEATAKQRALANVKAQPKNKVSLKKAPWEKDDKMKKEEVELDEKNATVKQQKALKALMTKALDGKRAKAGTTSAIAQNGDFVVKDGGSRIIGRLKAGTYTDPLKEEKSPWRVYNRILEMRKDAHTKGATEPEAMDSKASGSEKEFVDMHGGLDGNSTNIDGAKAAADTAKNATANVKAGGGMNRPGDQKTGDKNIIKSTFTK